MKKEENEFKFNDFYQMRNLKKSLQELRQECLKLEKLIEAKQNNCSHQLIITNREKDFFLAFGLGEKVRCLLCGMPHNIYHDRYRDVFTDKLVIDLTKKDYTYFPIEFILETLEEKLVEYQTNHQDASLNEIYQYLNHLTKEDFSHSYKLK